MLVQMRNRKSGSSTLAHYLRNWAKKTGAHILTVEEWEGLNQVCMSRLPDMGFSVTSIRHPLARHLSELYYAGPLAKCEGGVVKTKPCSPNLLARSSNETEVWKQWIAYGERQHAWRGGVVIEHEGPCRFNAGQYSDNYYVRRLTDQCDVPSCSSRFASTADNSISIGLACEGMSKRSELQCAGARPLGESDLKKAKTALAAFSFVAVVEHLDEDIKVLDQALLASDIGTFLQHGLLLEAKPVNRNSQKPIVNPYNATGLSPILVDVLQRNHLDMRLYEWVLHGGNLR